jgi:hypothetical protein
MSHLTLAGVSADGRRLLLVDAQGVEFTLDITPGVRAALRGQTTRLGQLENEMTSTLRPRDIQSRIRAGESPEEVAESAGSTVESIMTYAGPVLAEREHIVERAQKSSVRRTSGDGASGSHQSRILGDAVTTHLQSLDIRPERVDWDSFRREDGRWVLTADYRLPGHEGSARFVFDAPGNYVLTDNDDARWLVGDRAAAAEPAQSSPPDDLEQARQRRLAAVSEELPLGEDAIGLFTDDPAPGATDRPEAPAADAPSESAEPAARDQAPEESDDPAASRTPPRRAAKKRGRSSVPSWDEIMFGGGDK